MLSTHSLSTQYSLNTHSLSTHFFLGTVYIHTLTKHSLSTNFAAGPVRELEYSSELNKNSCPHEACNKQNK